MLASFLALAVLPAASDRVPLIQTPVPVGMPEQASPDAADASSTVQSAESEEAKAKVRRPAPRRPTFAPNNTGEDSPQGQLTQIRGVTPSRFNVRNKPVPAVPDPYPAAARGYGPRAGPYYYSRWAEDWSSLRAPGGKRNDPFDPLKFIPLASDGDVYLTLSGEHRTRLNFTTNPRLRDAKAEEQYLIRNVVGADLHVGPYLRAFGEIGNANAFGSPGVDGSAMQQNALFVQQLFAEASVPLGEIRVTARMGRQEFMDGPPNVIHIRPAPNVYTSQDGVRVNIDGRRARISLFDFHAVQLGRGSFDDPTNDRDRFRGVSSSFVVPEFRLASTTAKLFFDPFVWNRRNRDKRWGTTTGVDDRNFYGARLWGTAGDATLDLSVIRQDGRFADRDISAWGIFANAGYLLSDGAWHPRIGAHVDYTSGGGAYGSGKLRNFSFFDGSIPYFSWGNLVGPSNLSVAAVNMRTSPLPRVSLTFEYELLRRNDDRDAVYTFLEAAYAGTQTVRGHAVGSLLRADIAWQADPHVQVALKADVLVAGPVLERAGYSNSTFLGPEVQVRF